MNLPVVVFLSGISLFRLVWLLVRGHRIHAVEAIENFSLLPPGKRQVVAWLARKGLIGSVEELAPTDRSIFFAGWCMEQPDLFRVLEPEIHKSLPFDGDSIPEYRLAVSHAIGNHAHDRLRLVSMLENFARTCPKKIRFIGADSHVIAWHRSYFGSDLPFEIQVGLYHSALSNLVRAVGVGFVVVAWLLRRVRGGKPAFKSHFLGADGVGEARHLYLLSQITDRPEDVAIVCRNRRQHAAMRARADMAQYEIVYPEDVSVTPGEALSLAGMAIGDLARIFLACRGMPSELFFACTKLVFRRVIFRAFLARHRLGSFFSKDDYNPDHIIRTQELRRIGAKSLGICHGAPAPEVIEPRLRHIDFDYYYSFGAFPFRHHYGESWAAGVTLRPVGAYGMNREQLTRIDLPRSKDIVFFISRLPNEREIFAEVCKIAAAFPDRTVWVKAKYPADHPHHQPDFAGEMEQPANLIHIWETAYELMLKCRYALCSGNSTVALEAIQYGLTTWVWDSFDPTKPTYYRAFPGLSVRTADEVIQSIRDLEQGRKTWNREAYADLVALSGPTIFDVIRQDLGLAPKQTILDSEVA